MARILRKTAERFSWTQEQRLRHEAFMEKLEEADRRVVLIETEIRNLPRSLNPHAINEAKKDLLSRVHEDQLLQELLKFILDSEPENWRATPPIYFAVVVVYKNLINSHLL